MDNSCLDMRSSPSCFEDEPAPPDPTRRLLFLRRQRVELAPDMRRFRRRVGERDGAIEGLARLLRPPQLLQERSAHAVKIEIALEPSGQRRDELERRLGTGDLRER